MKRIAFLAAVAAAISASAAHVCNLRSGLNAGVGPGGKIVAVEVVTSNAAATVSISSVQTVTVRTNAFVDVSVPHTVYSFSVTNYDGAASVATNVWDRFRRVDWLADVETSAGVTQQLSRIVGAVTWADTNVVESVFKARVPYQSYTVTNELISVTASGHHGSASNSVYWLCGDLLVTGAGADDTIVICVE